MSDEQTISDLLADQCDRLFSNLIDTSLLKAAEAGQHPAELAKGVDELGLSLALVPEAYGGVGLGWADLSGVFETLGYYAAPVLLGETIIANWMGALAGFDVRGKALGFSADVLNYDDGTGTVSGCCGLSWSEEMGAFVAVARSDARDVLCLLEHAAGKSGAVVDIGRDPRQQLRFEAALPLASAPIDFMPDGPACYLAMLRAAQISGALARMLFLAIDYGNTRVQFGRAIGKFQAIQHMIAELAAESASARAAVQLGLRGLDAGKPFESAAVAKIRTSLAVRKATAIVHEVHGAIGVTEEHILHHFTRRAWQWRADAGDEHFWSERLGHHVLQQDGGAFWGCVVSLLDTGVADK